MGLSRNLLIAVASLAPSWWASRLHHPVFVIGCGRSGTTALSNWLDSHPNIANLSEANDLWDPLGYPWGSSPNGRKSPPVWIDPEAYTARWWADNQDRGEAIRAVFGAYQTIRHAQVFVNKTPMNSYRLPYLLDLFPNSRFIHIIRDGRAVAYSYAQKQRADMQKNLEAYQQMGINLSFDEVLLQLAQHWRYVVEKIAREDEQFQLSASGRFLEVTYEALCEDTPAVLANIAGFIGVDAGDFESSDRKIVMKNQNYKWQQELSSELIDAINAIQKPALERWGYVEPQITRREP